MIRPQTSTDSDSDTTEHLAKPTVTALSDRSRVVSRFIGQ